MTEDSRSWANADAGTFGRLSSASTNFNVAQIWQQEAPRQERDANFSKRDFEEALDKVSEPQTPERA